MNFLKIMLAIIVIDAVAMFVFGVARSLYEKMWYKAHKDQMDALDVTFTEWTEEAKK